MDNHLLRSYYVPTGALPSRSLQIKWKVGAWGKRECLVTGNNLKHKCQVCESSFQKIQLTIGKQAKLEVQGRRKELERP